MSRLERIGDEMELMRAEKTSSLKYIMKTRGSENVDSNMIKMFSETECKATLETGGSDDNRKVLVTLQLHRLYVKR